MGTSADTVNGTAHQNGTTNGFYCEAHKKARDYLHAGRSVVPVKAKKVVALERGFTNYSERPALETVDGWYRKNPSLGVGICCGPVSGDQNVLDFEHADFHANWTPLVEAEAPGLLERLPLVQTPGKGKACGFHVYFLSKIKPTTNKLAMMTREEAKDRTGDEGSTTGIELKNSGYVVAPGSPPMCHPKGGIYQHIAGPAIEDTPAITDAEAEVLFRCARALDRAPAEEKGDWAGKSNPKAANNTGELPGDRFCRLASWNDVLAGTDWQIASIQGEVTYIRRPGKDRGISASVGYCSNESGTLLRCFTTNGAPFQEGESYNKFRAWALLHHSGDFTAAAREAAKLFPDPEQPRAKPRGQPMGGSHQQTKPPKTPRQPPQPYVPFPTHVLPEQLRQFVEQAAKALGCDESLVALPVLAAVASAIGNTRTIMLKPGWFEPSIVWALVASDSGTVKTPAYKKAVGHLFRAQKRLLKEFEEKCAKYQAELAAHKEAERKAKESGEEPGKPPKKPVYHRVILSDITIQKLAEVLQENPRGSLVARDEMAAWFGSFRQFKGTSEGSDLPNWLEMFNAGTIIVDRKTTEQRHYFVERASVSVTGGVQPGVLARQLTQDFLDAGGAARLLMAMPPKVDAKVWTEMYVEPGVEQAYHDTLDRLLALRFAIDGQTGEQNPHIIRLSPEAKAGWIRFYNTWAREQASAQGSLAAAFSKLEAYAARFALLHHVVSHAGLGLDDLVPVELESVNAGATLCYWFANESRRIYSILGENQSDTDTRRLVEFVRSRGGKTTVKELQRSDQRKYLTRDHAEAALDTLVQEGMGEWVARPVGSKGGRPTLDFVLATPQDPCDETDETDETPDGEQADNPPSEDPVDETPAHAESTTTKQGVFGVSSVSSVSSQGVKDTWESHGEVSSENDPGEVSSPASTEEDTEEMRL